MKAALFGLATGVLRSAIVFLLAGFPVSVYSQVVLVEDGTGKAIIVLADNPSSAARSGAELLSAQIERISGARLPVVGQSLLEETNVSDGRISAMFKGYSPPVFILVGESDLTGRLGAGSSGLGPGGIQMRTFPNALVLLGPDNRTPSDPDGTRYAVITFLEEVLGFRMLWPGELGLIAPSRKTITIPTLDKTYTPSISQRRIRNAHYNDRLQSGFDYLGMAKAEFDQKEKITMGGDNRVPNWFMWQRLGGDLGLVAGHSYGYVWEKYHREHPEWFAMQANGSRDLSKLTPERARLCKSNMTLIKALAEDKISEIEKTGKKSISLVPNDGGLACFCMCPDCRKLDPPNGKAITLLDNSSGPRKSFEYVSLTDRMVWFWNRLAALVTAKVPDARLTVYAYSAYKEPPVREKLHPSLAVGFVDMTYTSDAECQRARENFNAWSEAASMLYWRPNLLLFAAREGVPAVYVHKLGEDLAYFAGRSLKGTDFDSCQHHWATAGLNYYVLARLLWNPASDVDAVLDDYCRSGFGSAWRQVRRYFTRIEELTNEIAARERSVTAPYTPEVTAELNSLLDAARDADPDETVRRRVEFLRRGPVFAAFQNKAHSFISEHPDKRISADEKKQILSIQEEKWHLMRRFSREEPLAVNMPLVAWGSESLFRKYGWKGALNMPRKVVDADEDGRPVPVPDK